MELERGYEPRAFRLHFSNGMELERVSESILLMVDASERAAVSAAVGDSGLSSCRLNRNEMVRPGLLLSDVFRL